MFERITIFAFLWIRKCKETCRISGLYHFVFPPCSITSIILHYFIALIVIIMLLCDLLFAEVIRCWLNLCDTRGNYPTCQLEFSLVQSKACYHCSQHLCLSSLHKVCSVCILSCFLMNKH